MLCREWEDVRWDWRIGGADRGCGLTGRWPRVGCADEFAQVDVGRRFSFGGVVSAR